MRFTAASITFTVPDVEEASRVLSERFGFAEPMAAPGFAALACEELGGTVTQMALRSPVLPEPLRNRAVKAAVLALMVEDIDGEAFRLLRQDATFLLELQEEARGERLLMVHGSDGLVQLRILAGSTRPKAAVRRLGGHPRCRGWSR